MDFDESGGREGVPGPPHVVRMFPDHADTVLWFTGPVDYEDSGLSVDLVRALRDWEQASYDGVAPDVEWRSRSLAHAHHTEGERLAARVADELGSGYEVEYGDGTPRRVRSTRESPGLPAAAAFDLLAAEQRAADERLAQLIAEDGGTRADWSAHAPLSGNTFTPE